ncbi:hypothetical protein PMIN02_012687 [Paraphaeosphaeria minitans]
MLGGLSLFVDWKDKGSDRATAGLSSSNDSIVSSLGFRSESEDGLDEINVYPLECRNQSCELTDDSELSLVCDTLVGRDSGCEFSVCNDASEFDRNESDKLGGHPFISEDLLLDADDCDSWSRKLCLLLSSERGRMRDIVLDLLSARLSSTSSGVASFFSGSGCLKSSFPFSSDAKNSFPRPNTTCKLAKSRSAAFTKRKSSRSDGRS